MNSAEPRPQRILMTADPLGGIWTYAVDLSQVLAAQEIDVALALMGGPLGPAQREEVSRIPGLQVFEGPYKLEWMDSPWQDVGLAGSWLLDLERTFQPEVVHLNGYVHGALPWNTPVLTVGHSCVLSWWRAVRGDLPPHSWSQYRRSVARGLWAADLVVAPSASMLESLDDFYGPLPCARVIPNARKTDLFYPEPKEHLVLTVGRLWDEAKNVLALEAAAPRISWPIYAAGRTLHPESGQVQIQHLQCLGQLDPPALASWWRRAAIAALPAKYEPFGLCVLEAALSECALVLGKIRSLEENWEGAALFVPPSEPSALADAVERLIRDEPLRLHLASEAFRRASQFTMEQMTSAYLEAYSEIISARKLVS